MNDSHSNYSQRLPNKTNTSDGPNHIGCFTFKVHAVDILSVRRFFIFLYRARIGHDIVISFFTEASINVKSDVQEVNFSRCKNQIFYLFWLASWQCRPPPGLIGLTNNFVKYNDISSSGQPVVSENLGKRFGTQRGEDSHARTSSDRPHNRHLDTASKVACPQQVHVFTPDLKSTQHGARTGICLVETRCGLVGAKRGPRRTIGREVQCPSNKLERKGGSTKYRRTRRGQYAMMGGKWMGRQKRTGRR